jgi:hypothetical protein
MKAFHPKKVIQRSRHYCGSVMILDKIGYYDKTSHVKVNATPSSQPYCEEIVVTEILSFRNQGQVAIFQQHNARTHTAGQTKEVLRLSNIDVLN